MSKNDARKEVIALCKNKFRNDKSNSSSFETTYFHFPVSLLILRHKVLRQYAIIDVHVDTVTLEAKSLEYKKKLYFNDLRVVEHFEHEANFLYGHFLSQKENLNLLKKTFSKTLEVI